MAKFPAMISGLLVIAAFFLWYVGSYNGALLLAIAGLLAMVAAVAVGWID